ncbi:MAG TPA: AraC family transcriptional regulator [Polyangiaceae bacterium]
MPSARIDARTWIATDRPGERIAIGRPLPGVEVMSVRGSDRHWREAHDTFTCGLIRRGQPGVAAEWRTRGRSVTSGPGSIMAIEPGEVHVTERVHLRRSKADFDVVRIAPEHIADAVRRLDMTQPFHFKTPTLDDPVVYSAFEAFVVEVAEGASPLVLEATLCNAIGVVVTRAGEASGGAHARLDPVRDYRLRRVRDRLREEDAARIALDELAELAGVSKWQLCRLFLRTFGVSAGEYRNTLRLGKAVRRLTSGDPIQRIAIEHGYTEAPYFNRVFKKHYGVSPGVWRRLVRANDRLIRTAREARLGARSLPYPQKG